MHKKSALRGAILGRASKKEALRANYEGSTLFGHNV